MNWSRRYRGADRVVREVTTLERYVRAKVFARTVIAGVVSCLCVWGGRGLGWSDGRAVVVGSVVGLFGASVVSLNSHLRWRVYLYNLGVADETGVVSAVAKIAWRVPDRVALFTGRALWDSGSRAVVHLGIREYGEFSKALYFGRDDLLASAGRLWRRVDVRSDFALDRVRLLECFDVLAKVSWPSDGVLELVELAVAMAGDTRQAEVLMAGFWCVAELAEEFGGDEASWAMVASFVRTCNKAENTGMSFEILGRYGKVATTVRGLNKVTARAE